MQAGYAAAYMSRLASVIAERDGLAPFTDRQRSRDVLVDRYVGVEPDDEVDKNEALLASLSIIIPHLAAHTNQPTRSVSG